MTDKNPEKPYFIFERTHYKIMLFGLAIIILGFVVMSGGGSEDPNTLILKFLILDASDSHLHSSSLDLG